MTPIAPRTLTRLQLLAALLAVLGCGLLFAWQTQSGDRAYWIEHPDDAFWITVPRGQARAKALKIQRDAVPTFTFEREFDLGEPPATAVIEVRALRSLALRLNDQVVPLHGRDARRWKRPARVDVAPWLRRGTNRLSARVASPEGPPLLLIRSDALGDAVATGKRWQVHRGEKKRRAAIANDVGPYPAGADLPRPAQALRARAPLLAAVFLLCALPVFVRVRLPAGIGGPHWPRTAFAALCAFWLALFALKAAQFPLSLGFDARAHLDYVELIAREWRVPRADEGWEMFHPPLFYSGVALLQSIASPEADSLLHRALLRLLPMLAGLASAFVAGRIALRLAPDRPGVAAVALLGAGLLPMNAYLATFVSNETAHAALVAAGLWATCDALVAPKARPRSLVLAALAFGLALLTKSTTGLPIALAAVGLVGAKLAFVEGRALPRALGATAAMLGAVALVAGWFYARNAWLFGNPFVSNLDAFAEWTYWIPPGFHTPEWYLGFGEVFRQPFFASFHSFWDGFYGSFWADGYASGRNGVQYPNAWWDYDAMAAVVLLAAPATGLLAFGLGTAAVQAARGPDLGRRLALSLLLIVVFGMLVMPLLLTLRLPFNALPKAFYSLPAGVPLAVVFALGIGALHRLGSGPLQRGVRALLHGYLGALGVAIALSLLR